MNVTKIFNPKGWLIGFAILHTVLFLIPQLFAISATASMNWGDGNVPAHAEFYELQMGVLGIGYTPILIAMAVLTEGALRAKLALVTGLSMGTKYYVRVTAHTTVESNVSDHRPVVCDLELREEAREALRKPC